MSLPGAIMISFFFDRILRKVRSFWGSMSLTTLRAFMSSCWICPAYWTVLELSRVLLIGMPIKDRSQETLQTEQRLYCFFTYILINHKQITALNNFVETDTFCINNDDSLHSFLWLNSLECLLHLSLQINASIKQSTETIQICKSCHVILSMHLYLYLPTNSTVWCLYAFVTKGCAFIYYIIRCISWASKGHIQCMTTPCPVNIIRQKRKQDELANVHFR